MRRIIWRFRARPERVDGFQRIYSSKGARAKLIGRSSEYQGTLRLTEKESLIGKSKDEPV